MIFSYYYINKKLHSKNILKYLMKVEITMLLKKRLLICTIILLIVCISIFTIILDFSRLFGDKNLYNKYPSDLIKRTNVILAAFLVWLAGKDSLNKLDNTHMKFVFLFIICGEVSFLMAKPVLAIGFFAVCQSLLIIRHCKGFGSKIKKASLIAKYKLALSLFILILTLISVVVLIYPMTIINSLFLMGVFYGIVLSLSLWAAIVNYFLSLFPSKNSKMIAIGMVCFYFCDISVGLDGLLGYGTAWLFATSLTWVFYTPAITLLALSCYRYDSSEMHVFSPLPQ